MNMHVVAKVGRPWKYHVGQVIGAWTLVQHDKNKHWVCRCACGTLRSIKPAEAVWRKGCNSCNRTYRRYMGHKSELYRPAPPPEPPQHRVTVAECRQLVGEFFRIPKEDMLSPRRCLKYARPRQMAMALAREFTTASFPLIGKHFGRDHTTAIHAVARIRDLEKTSPRIADRMENFRLAIQTFKAQQAVTLSNDVGPI